MTDFKELIKKQKYSVFIVILFLLFPLISPSDYITHVMVLIFLFAAMATAWNVIGGYGAQVSWCHATFFAIGAYTSFLLFLRFNISPIISIFAAMIMSFILAMIVGYPSFRLRGVYFSLATIAFAEIVKTLLLYFTDFTGGANGLMLPYKGASLMSLQFKTEIPYYYISFVVLALLIFVTWKFEKSKLGYFLKAIKEDEDAAESLGIKAYKVKLTAFALSAVMISIVGPIYAFNISYIDPIGIGHLDLSIKIGTIAIIGGVATLWGPLLGAIIIIPLSEITNALLGSTRGGASTAIYGLILILVIIFKPEGLISLFDKFKGRKKDKKLKVR